MTESLWRGVEGPRRCLLADALRSFPATKTMKEIKKSQRRDDKRKGDGSIESGCWTEAFFITLDGPGGQ